MYPVRSMVLIILKYSVHNNDAYFIITFCSTRVRQAIIDKKKPEFEKTLSKGKIENGNSEY